MDGLNCRCSAGSRARRRLRDCRFHGRTHPRAIRLLRRKNKRTYGQAIRCRRSESDGNPVVIAWSCCAFGDSADQHFNADKVAKELALYRRKGPRPTTAHRTRAAARKNRLRDVVSEEPLVRESRYLVRECDAPSSRQLVSRICPSAFGNDADRGKGGVRARESTTYASVVN